MWVFSSHGFFSVVTDKRNAERVVIRTRDRRHMLSLKKRFPHELQSIALEVHSGTDYQFRLAVGHAVWARIMFEMAMDIDYPNFKNMAERRKNVLGSGFVNALHDIWQVLWDVSHPKKLGVGVWDE